MIKNYFLRHSDISVSRWIVVLIDIFLLNLSIVFANLLRFDFVISELVQYHIFIQMGMVSILGGMSILISSSHRGLIRHTSQYDLIRILKAVIIVVMLLASVNYALLLLNNLGRPVFVWGIEYHLLIPNSILLIFFPIALFFLVFFRMSIKLVYYSITTYDTRDKINVLIYGADKEGISVKQTLTSNQSSPFRVVGFIDDQPGKKGKSLHGVEIFRSSAVTNEFLAKHNVKEIILAMSNIGEEKKTEIYNRLLGLSVTIKTVPPVDAWINGELNMKQIQNVNIEDLLMRPPIMLENQAVIQEIFNKTILVTGAAGSIGSELSRQLFYFKPHRIVFVDQAETPLFELEQDLVALENELEKYDYFNKVKMEFVIADVSNKQSIGDIIQSVKPHLIYHAAAYKHVPLMEANPLEGLRVNVFGTCNLADAASSAGVEKFIMISTDKAVNPTSFMGATKRMAEIYIQSLKSSSGNKTAFITTRFGNVLGSNGSVTRTFKKQILAGGPVTVTHPEITRYFMTIPEACQLVLEAATMGKGGEIFIFDMGKPIKILDLAKNLIRLSGYLPEREIKIVYSGLRPGEKLYEELLNESEFTLPTHHPKIMIARVRNYAFEETTMMIGDLMQQYKQGDQYSVVRMLKKFIPEYISKNSVFSTFD